MEQKRNWRCRSRLQGVARFRTPCAGDPYPPPIAETELKQRGLYMQDISWEGLCQQVKLEEFNDPNRTFGKLPWSVSASSRRNNKDTPPGKSLPHVDTSL